MIVALAGCDSGGAFFEIEVTAFEGTQGCNPAPNITGFVLDVGPSPGNYDQCFRSPCTRSGGESYECVSGFETPAVTPGESIHIRLGLYEDGITIGACAVGGNPSVEEGDTITLNLSCGQGSCRPAIPMIQCPLFGDQ